METKACINSRRSCRSFNGKSLDDAVVSEILEAGLRAPSAKNMQPWRLYVLTGKEKDTVGRLLIEHAYEGSDTVSGRCILHASHLVLVCTTQWEENHVGMLLSIGACMENMHLAATDMGVACLWLGDVSDIAPAVCTAFDIQLPLVSAMAFGRTDSPLSPKSISADGRIIRLS